MRQKFSPAHLTPLTKRASPKDVRKERASPRSILLLDAEQGSLSASAVCSLEGLLIGGGKGGRGPRRRESPTDSLEPHPGQYPEAESSSGKRSATCFTEPSPQPLPLAQAQQRGVPWARREEKPPWAASQRLRAASQRLRATPSPMGARNVVLPGR